MKTWDQIPMCAERLCGPRTPQPHSNAPSVWLSSQRLLGSLHRQVLTNPALKPSSQKRGVAMDLLAEEGPVGCRRADKARPSHQQQKSLPADIAAASGRLGTLSSN